MKAGYAKRKKVKRARSRKARREDAGDDQEAAAAELTGEIDGGRVGWGTRIDAVACVNDNSALPFPGMGGRAVREDDSDESGDEAMATDDLERVDVTSRVPTTPNDESPPSTSREQPPVTGRAKHKCGRKGRGQACRAVGSRDPAGVTELPLLDSQAGSKDEPRHKIEDEGAAFPEPHDVQGPGLQGTVSIGR